VSILVVEEQSLIVNKPRYSRLVQKFKSLFLFDASTTVYYLPGNNDVG